MREKFVFEEELDESAISIDINAIESRVSVVYVLIKRIIDIVGSLVGLILLFPLFISVAIFIKLESKGPIIFKQIRVGKNSKPFYIYKFRSMKEGSPNKSTTEFRDSTYYITKIGRFIRKTSIDELPQLFNILKGDMSLVGPRPVIESERDLLELREKYIINTVLPGITGLAQINGRDHVDIIEKVKYDYEYLVNRSLKVDISILIQTCVKVIKSEGIKSEEVIIMENKVKIVQVTAIDDAMDNLLRRLNEMSIEEGYNLTCVCSYGERTDKLKQEGFNIYNINIERSIKPFSNIKSIYEMYKFFKKEKPDIVHVHTPIASVLSRIAAKLAKVPNIVYTAHGFYFHDNMSPIVYKIILNIEKYIGRLCTDVIFTQSEEDRVTALKNKFLRNNKVICIGNGIDNKVKFNPNNINEDKINELYRELGIKKEDKVISFTGRLVKEKGILDLLEAFDQLNRDEYKLLIIGDIFQGDRDTQTRELINKYKDNKNIILTGMRKDINNLLYITDVFCLPSYREGMPRSIIEAMSMECAVIATNIRGCREEVVDRETGYLVDVNSPKEIASKIEIILDNKELLNDMKIRGRKKAERLYYEDNVVRMQLDIFKKLIEIENETKEEEYAND